MSEQITPWQLQRIEELAQERDELQETLTVIEREVAKVYCELTGGRISKASTAAEDVIQVVRELQQDEIERLTQERNNAQRLVSETHDLLRSMKQERDTLRAKLDELLSQRMDESEAKIGTRPADVVVGELEAENRELVRANNDLAKRHDRLEAENRRLREAAERVVRANQDVENHGYTPLRRMVYALEKALGGAGDE